MLKKKENKKNLFYLLLLFQLIPIESYVFTKLSQPQQPQKTAGKTNLFLFDVYLLIWANLISY